MTNKLYVGGLQYSVDNTQLESMFAEYGTVISAKVIMDRELGRSKGFGFVEMSSESEAQNAIKQLNGTEHGGHSIKVNEAREQNPRSGGQGGFRNNRDQDRDSW